jgi:HEAT repeat protein
MDTLQREAMELRAVANLGATAGAREAVLAGLRSKWEGIQAIALDVLGRWGGSDSKVLLRTFLLEAFAREAGWAIRGVAVRNLAPLLTEEDAGWVLDLYFGSLDRLQKHELLRLVLALPAEAARPRLVRELRNPDSVNRQAAVKAVGNMPYTDRRALLLPLRSDPARFVRSSAKVLSQE